MDIGIILDSSRSIRRQNYESIKKSLARLVEYFDVSESGTHFGLLHYNQHPTLDFNFKESSLYDVTRLEQLFLCCADQSTSRKLGERVVLNEQ